MNSYRLSPSAQRYDSSRIDRLAPFALEHDLRLVPVDVVDGIMWRLVDRTGDGPVLVGSGWIGLWGGRLSAASDTELTPWDHYSIPDDDRPAGAKIPALFERVD